MSIKVLTIKDLIVDKEVEWHIYDGTGRLLIKKGMKLRSLSQIEKLIELGAFYRLGTDDEFTSDDENISDDVEIVEGVINSALSPFGQIEEVLSYMEKLFNTIVHEPAHSKKRLPEKLYGLSKSIISF